MKRNLLYILTAMMMLMTASCGKDFDDSEIWESIEELKSRVSVLEQKVADNISAIQSMVSVGSIASWSYDAETGKAVITLVGGKSITIDMSLEGYSLITVEKGSDGAYYWALCVDGVSTPLEIDGKKIPVSVTPALKISDSNEWMISVDGGKTWVNTGIKYQGQGGSATTPLFFQDVKQEGDCLVLTLADGTSLKVAIVGDASISLAVEALWFSRVATEKSVAVDMVNVKAYTVTEKPEGWKARMDDNYLYVTAPENFTDYPEQGTVKVLALFEEGVSPAILSLEVAYEPMFTMSIVNGKISVALSEHTAEDYSGYVLEGWKKADFTVENVASWLNSESSSLTPYQGSADYEYSEIIDNYSASEDYVVFATPYLSAAQVAQGKASYAVEDVICVEAKPVGEAWTFSDVYYDSATFTAEMDSPFFGGFTKLEDWNNYERDNFLETLQYGGAESYNIPSYNGPANCFPDGVPSININPATEYVIWYLPEKPSNVYVSEDFQTFVLKTPDVSYDASITAPAYTVKDVTVSGFTADVTPSADVYKTYAAIVKAEGLPQTELEIVKYLVSINAYSTGRNVNTVKTSSFNSNDEVYLLAVSMTRDGKYGAVIKEKVALKELTFTDNLGVTVTDISYGLGDVTLSLDFTGNPETITYMAATYTYYTDEVLQKMMALDQLGTAETVKVSSLGGKLYLSNLTLGAEHTFYAIVRDSDNNSSYLYKYTFIPTNSIDYITSDSADYGYGMPQLTDNYTATGGNTYTVTVSFDMPSTCQKYWVFKGDPEYFTGDPWTDSDKLVTGQLEMAGAMEYTESTEVTYNNMLRVSRIYMVWLDDKGNYHAIYEYDPKK